MNQRIIQYRTELAIAAAKKRIDARKARELDESCPDCERSYKVCECDHEEETTS